MVAVASTFRESAQKRKEPAMAGKDKKKVVVVPKKTYWHLYSLQALQAKQLTDVVNKVLRREYVLIK